MTHFDPFRLFRDPRTALILKELRIMSAVTDALNAKIDAITASVAAIRQDIADIKAGLPTSGGMSADEVAALSARLDTLATTVAELDSENPTPPTA